MVFEIKKGIEILERTPTVLENLLNDLSYEWIHNNEGENTWSPYTIIGHLIHGEKTDWIPRARIILSDSDDKRFEPFDRFAQMNNSGAKPIKELLHEFRLCRVESINELTSFEITFEQLQKKGIHPQFGEVTLNQLLATWVAHDLGHIAQIARVMAKQYKEEVGPWREYLRVVRS